MVIGQPPELDALELDTIAEALSVLSKGESKPSPAATAFCLALACCACRRVPASLFYRPCLSRREWHSSGEIVDSQTHLEELPSWLFTLFDTTLNDQGSGTQQATNGDTLSVPESPQHVFHDQRVSSNNGLLQAAPLSTPRRDSSGRSPARNKGSRLATHREPQEHTQIHLEIVGLRPNHVDLLRRSHLILSLDLQNLINSRDLSITTSEGVMYFAMAEIWKETILQAASEKLCVQTWTILVILASYSIPSPYTEPLWQVFQSQLQEVIEGTILPFLSVIDLKHFQAWSHQHRRNLFLLLIYERLCASTHGGPCLPFGLEISQHLRSSSPNQEDLCSSLIFLAQWLDGLDCVLEGSQSSLQTHLDSWPAKVADDPRMRFLIFSGIENALISHGVRESATKTSTLRNWWQGQKVFDVCTLDRLTKVLWQARSGTTISLASVAMVLDHDIRSALGFTLAQRQCLSEARSVLGDCIIRAQGLWPGDSPTRVLLLTEFINCSNTLEDEIREESPATGALKHIIEQDLPYRFDIICFNIALADSYIRQRDYKTALEILTDIVENAQLSNDISLRIALRLSKARRRLVRRQEVTAFHPRLLEESLARQENVPESLRFECLEETYAVATETSQRVSSDNSAVRQILRDHSNDCGQSPVVRDQWRVSAILAALDSDVPPFSEVVNNESDTEVSEYPNERLSRWHASQSFQLNRAATLTSSLDGSNSFRRQRLLNYFARYKPGSLGPIVIRVLVLGDLLVSGGRPLRDDISRLTLFEGSVAFEVISMSSSVEINLLVNPSIPGSLKYFDTKMLFDLVIVNLGNRRDEMPRARTSLEHAGYRGPIVGMVNSLHQSDMQYILDQTCQGFFEQPRLHKRPLSSANRLPHLAATALRRCQMEMLTKFYCHERLPEPFKSSTSSTDFFGSSKTPLVVRKRPRMILFPVFSELQSSNILRLSQLLVDAPGLHPIRITDYVVQPLPTQYMIYFENFTPPKDFRIPTQMPPDEQQVEIGSLFIGLNILEERLALMLGDHNANHEPQVVRDVADFAWSSVVKAKNFRQSGRISEISLTTKRLRVQSMPDPKRYWADFMSNIVQYHIKRKTSETRDILERLLEGRTFYLVTGLRTYLDPKLEEWLNQSSSLNGHFPYILQVSPIVWAGSKVAALELCQIDVQYKPSQFRVAKPTWYVLWGPHERDDELWPPKPVKPIRQASGSKALTFREIAELSLPSSEDTLSALKPNYTDTGTGR